eukprot:TRINITY_DN339_c4_g1_i1.p1 TRINITY_DN339_c4_g1~~TRINITY_DN339_c4_g1_i1.p1  ORF type:complete len:237 (+),score=64.51 TRINITY_DN339_c4_g1_i1:129-839(+)
MSGLWSYFITKFTLGGERQVRKDGVSKNLTIAQRVCVKTQSMETVMEECMQALGTRVEWYQITGDKFKPIAWGDEAVIVDEEYLAELPKEVAKVFVAERVSQVASKPLRKETNWVLGNLAVGVGAGAATVLYRLGQSHTLRRAFTIATLSTVVGAFTLRSPTQDRTLHLKKALTAFNDPNVTSAVLAVEEQRLQAVETAYNENVTIDPNTGAQQHRLLDHFELRQATERVAAIKAI